MKRHNTLYFESAGAFRPEEYGDLNSCRIRTAFSLSDGRRIYLEMIDWTPSPEQIKYFNAKAVCGAKLERGKAYVAICDIFEITNDIDAYGYNISDENANQIYIDRYSYAIEWTKAAVLKFVNSLGADFSDVEVLPNLAGYCVFVDTPDDHNGNIKNYNYGDEFNYNAAQTAARIAKYNEIQEQDRIKTGQRFPCFSFYVDKEDPDYCIYSACYAGIPEDERRKRIYIPE